MLRCILFLFLGEHLYPHASSAGLDSPHKSFILYIDSDTVYPHTQPPRIFMHLTRSPPRKIVREGGSKPLPTAGAEVYPVEAIVGVRLVKGKVRHSTHSLIFFHTI